MCHSGNQDPAGRSEDGTQPRERTGGGARGTRGEPQADPRGSTPPHPRTRSLAHSLSFTRALIHLLTHSLTRQVIPVTVHRSQDSFSLPALDPGRLQEVSGYLPTHPFVPPINTLELSSWCPAPGLGQGLYLHLSLAHCWVTGREGRESSTSCAHVSGWGAAPTPLRGGSEKSLDKDGAGEEGGGVLLQMGPMAPPRACSVVMVPVSSPPALGLGLPAGPCVVGGPALHKQGAGPVTGV